MRVKKRLGFTLSFDYIQPSLCRDLISLLDDTTFTHLFIPETWGYDAFTQITSMSQFTSKLILGTGIVNLYSRSPGTLAQTAASLHDLTEGRFILGVGLSGPIVIQDWHGSDYYHPSPMQRTREYLEILRLILSGERVNYDLGELFSLKGFKLRSFETPLNIPLYLAAMGSQNVQLAGELADGWFPIWTSFTEIPNQKQHLKQGLAKRDPKLSKEEFEIAPYILTCASDTEKAKYLIKRHLTYYIAGMGTFYFNIVRKYGLGAEAKKIRAAFQAGDRELAAKLVSEDMLNRITVVGSPEYVISRYEEFRQLGTTIPVVMLPYNCPPDLAMDTINAFQG